MYRTPVALARANAGINDAIVSWGGQVLRHIIFEKPFWRERRCLESSWQKHSVVLKSDESDRMWAHRIHCRLNTPLQARGDRMDRLLLTVLLAQVWWKWEPRRPGPPLGLPRTRLVTDAASWQDKSWEVMPVVPRPSACCMVTAYQVNPGGYPLPYHIKCLGNGLRL